MNFNYWNASKLKTWFSDLPSLYWASLNSSWLFSMPLRLMTIRRGRCKRHVWLIDNRDSTLNILYAINSICLGLAFLVNGISLLRKLNFHYEDIYQEKKIEVYSKFIHQWCRFGLECSLCLSRWFWSPSDSFSKKSSITLSNRSKKNLSEKIHGDCKLLHFIIV